MLDFTSDNVDEITDNFVMTIENVTSGSVTYSVRDSEIDGVKIKKDDFMAIVDKKIVASNPSKVEVVKQLFANVEDIEYKEVCTLIYGLDVTEEELNEVVSFIEKQYPAIEVATVNGKQDIYSFIISLE